MSDHLRFFKQRKSLSQVFLRETWPCRKLVDELKAHHIEEVVEIGPGAGVLTRFLLAAGIKVVAVEKDDNLIPHLEEMARAHEGPGHLRVVHRDILKFSWEEWLSNAGASKKAVCGNIPYHISTPIVSALLELFPTISVVLLMTQLEFAERLAALPSNKNYGSLSVFTQLRGNCRLAFKVPRSCFNPIPKVDSAVVAIAPRSERIEPEILQRVELLTQRAFSQRRKMLSNSLAPFLEKAPKDARIDIDLTRRCETLSPAEYVMLAQQLF